MLIMSMRLFSSNIDDMTPANKPVTSVARSGVWNVGLIWKKSSDCNHMNDSTIAKKLLAVDFASAVIEVLNLFDVEK